METQITEYSPTAAALDALRTRYEGKLYEVGSPTGMAAAKDARKELAGYRTALERMRVKIKAPVLEQAKLIDTEAKRISAQISALEDPIAGQINAEESRIEAERIAQQQQEAGRQAGIMAAIEELRRLPITLAGATAAEVAAKGKELAATRSDDSGRWLVQFAEYWRDAELARDATIIALHELRDQRVQAETDQAQLAADRAELEQLRAAARAPKAAVPIEQPNPTVPPTGISPVAELITALDTLQSDPIVAAFVARLVAYRAADDMSCVPLLIELCNLYRDALQLESIIGTSDPYGDELDETQRSDSLTISAPIDDWPDLGQRYDK
jgi:hypothetical protein